MRPSRRWLLIGGAAAALAAGGWFGIAAPRGTVRAVLARVFGETIAAQPATAEFIADYLADLSAVDRLSLGLDGLQDRPAKDEEFTSEDRIVRAFAQSTNAVRSAETGEEFVYLGLHDPYRRPCVNLLTSQWL